MFILVKPRFIYFSLTNPNMDAISKLFLLDRNARQREAHTAHFLPAYAKVECVCVNTN